MPVEGRKQFLGDFGNLALSLLHEYVHIIDDRNQDEDFWDASAHGGKQGSEEAQKKEEARRKEREEAVNDAKTEEEAKKAEEASYFRIPAAVYSAYGPANIVALNFQPKRWTVYPTIDEEVHRCVQGDHGVDTGSAN